MRAKKRTQSQTDTNRHQTTPRIPLVPQKITVNSSHSHRALDSSARTMCDCRVVVVDMRRDRAPSIRINMYYNIHETSQATMGGSSERLRLAASASRTIIIMDSHFSCNLYFMIATPRICFRMWSCWLALLLLFLLPRTASHASHHSALASRNTLIGRPHTQHERAKCADLGASTHANVTVDKLLCARTYSTRAFTGIWCDGDYSIMGRRQGKDAPLTQKQDLFGVINFSTQNARARRLVGVDGLIRKCGLIFWHHFEL